MIVLLIFLFQRDDGMNNLVINAQKKFQKLVAKRDLNGSALVYFLHLAFLLIALSLLSSCSSNRPAGELSEITVLAQGKSIKQKPAMVAVCKGFYVTPEKLKDFFQHAALTHEEQVSSSYAKLPCYSSGTAYLGNDEIQWVLRAGGVGEFHNLENKTQNETSDDAQESAQEKTQKSFTKICGVSCCNTVQGVC